MKRAKMKRVRTRKRLYDAMLGRHLGKYRQMVFVSGPRQVGKTTTCRNHADTYANWDNTDDRQMILAGPGKPMIVPAQTLLSQLL